MDYFKVFLDSTTQQERYRLAGKTFKFKIYKAMELYKQIVFFMSVGAVWLEHGSISIFLLVLVCTLPLVLVAHYFKVSVEQPWLLLRYAAESFLIWLLYSCVLISYINIQNAWVFCILYFTFRYWERAEKEVSIQAFQNAQKPPSKNGSVSRALDL